MVEAACFYILVLFLGFLGLPLCFGLDAKQPDRGLSGAPQLALVIFAFLLLLVSRTGFIPWSFEIMGAMLIIWSILSFAWYLKNYQKLWSWIKDNYQTVAGLECVFLVVFVVALLLVSRASQIEGTEKFMDYALLNSIFHAPRFPPLDPWFSGEPVAYYWFGHLMAAVLCRLAFSSLDMGYNIMVALVLAFIFRLSMGLLLRLGFTWPKAFLGGLLVAFGGNLVPIYQMFVANSGGIEDLWLASRIIPGTITEFPFFSLLVGDLHAHYVMLPAFILYAMFLVQRPQKVTSLSCQLFFLNLLVAAQALGNPWNVPVALLLFSIVRLFSREKLPWWSLAPAVILLPFIMPLGYRELSLSFVSFTSPVFPFLLFWGIPLSMIFFALLLDRPSVSGLWFYCIVSSALLFFILPVASICLAILLMVSLSSFRDQKAINSMATAFVVAGLLLLIICEIFYLNDPYGHPYERMNTVFKLSYAAWPLFLIGAYTLFLLSKNVFVSRGFLGRILALIVIGLAFCYPSIGSAKRLFARVHTSSLDGLKPLSKTHPDDVSAIYWLRKRVRYGHVCAEAVGQSYSWSARFSTFTSCSGVVGWPGHEILWRNQSDLIIKRISDVKTLYTTKDISVGREILNRYKVSWLVACSLEKSKYGKGILPISNALLTKEYSKGECTIYSYHP